MSRGLLGYKKEINQMINLVFLSARVVFYLKSVIMKKEWIVLKMLPGLRE